MNINYHETRYVLPSIMNLDEHFSRTPNTIVFNDIMLDRDPAEVIEIICDISGDKSDSVASCSCGELVGNYYEGMKCRICGTVCESTLFGEIRNDSWLEIPASITAVLNPQAFRVLSRWIGNSNRQPILNQIMNMQLDKVPLSSTPFFSGMGFNWFYNNFNAVMTYFLSSHPTQSGRDASQSIRLFLEKAGNAIWCTKLPILSKIIQPVSKISKEVRYADSDIKNLIKSIFSLRSILLAEKMMKFTTDHIDRNFFRVYGEFLAYTNNILKYKLPKKPSILRKHVFGSRSMCSCRSVAIPITEPHDSDEVYFPWKLGVVVYKYHLLSTLVNKKGMTVMNAYNRIMNAINVYDHEIDLIMQDMINDCKQKRTSNGLLIKGLPILLNRNPTLRIGSIQLLFVTRIKPGLKEDPFASLNNTTPSEIMISLDQNDDDFGNDDWKSSASIFGDDTRLLEITDQVTAYVEDGAISVSPMIVKGPNLDFDGDEVNILPLFEMDEVEKYTRLHPAHRFISTDKLVCDCGDVTLSSQQFAILSGWVNDQHVM